MRQRIVKTLALGALGAVVLALPALAEDTKGKWQFGFGLSYLSTRDYIRSNADIAFAAGLPDETGLPGVGFVDKRPDVNILNQPSVRDNFKLDLNMSYGLTRWLAIEASVGHMRSPVGNIEFYVEDNNIPPLSLPDLEPLSTCGPSQNAQCYKYVTQDKVTSKNNIFLPVGQITETPVQLSALVRFRPESPFDPYIGLGTGYIFANLKHSGEFEDRSAEIQSLKVGVAFEGELVTGQPPTGTKNAIFPGFTPGPITATVTNAWEYHAIGGVDYFINEHLSFYVDARYVWTGGKVDIRTDGEHQVFLAANDLGRLLRQTQFLDPDPAHSTEPYLWEDRGFNGCVINGVPGIPNGTSCTRDKYFETEDKNGNGTLDTELGEDDGMIYVFPVGPGPGPFHQGWGPDTSRSIGSFFCPSCKNNGGGPDSEDRNSNLFLDRFLFYGLDLCSTQQGAGNPLCAAGGPSGDHYVWPQGCSQSTSDLIGNLQEGCPVPRSTSVTNSGIDDLQDEYTVQGGTIKLGGFSIGFGMKFTF